MNDTIVRHPARSLACARACTRSRHNSSRQRTRRLVPPLGGCAALLGLLEVAPPELNSLTQPLRVAGEELAAPLTGRAYRPARAAAGSARAP
jgi:hypothetical protein